MISTVPANRAIIHAFRSGMGARSRFVCGVTAMAVISGPILAAQASDRRQLERIEQALRQEGQAVVALADAAQTGHSLPISRSPGTTTFSRRRPGRSSRSS